MKGEKKTERGKERSVKPSKGWFDELEHALLANGMSTLEKNGRILVRSVVL